MTSTPNRLPNPGAITHVGVDADDTREAGDPITAYLFDDEQTAHGWAADDHRRTLYRVNGHYGYGFGEGYQTTTRITYETTEPKAVDA